MYSKQVEFDARFRSLEITTREVAAPAPGSLVARVTMAGVCGTDAHRLAGHVPGADVPVTFGHEAVGVVETAGPGAVDWSGRPVVEGDRIVWFPASAGCGECAACQEDMWVLCEIERWPAPADRPGPAGFQQYALLSARVPVYRIDSEAPDEAYTAFGCALPTAVEGLDVIGGITADDVVVIQGSGPVGLAYAALVALLRPAQLIVIGTPSSRLDRATDFGAMRVLDLATTTAEARAAEIAELSDGRGADLVIEAAGVVDAFPEGLDLLARRGRYLITGLFSGSATVSINPVIINNKLLTVRGAYGALHRHREQAVALVPELERRFHIAALVESIFPLAEIEAAIDHLGAGLAVKTAVIP